MKSLHLPSLWEGLGVGYLPFSPKGVGVGLLLLTSCNGKPTLTNVAEEDSLCIDTVATLDDVVLTDTVAKADSLMQDSL